MSIIHTLNDLVLSGEFWLLIDGCVSKDAAAKLELEQIQESLLIDSFPLFQRLPPTYVPVSFCENSVFQLEEAHKARPDSIEEQRCSSIIVWMQKGLSISRALRDTYEFMRYQVFLVQVS